LPSNKKPVVEIINRGHFFSSKNDLIRFFWMLHKSGILTFNSKADLVQFLEKSFSFNHGEKTNKVSNVASDIAEILKCSKDNEKYKIKKSNEQTKNVIGKIFKQLDETTLLEENGDDGWG
jgi:hypothetical protein